MNKINPSKKYTTTAEKTRLSYHDFMTLFFVAFILIIDFLPYFKSFEIIAPQFLYLTVLNVIIGLYIYANPVLLNRTVLAIFKHSYVFKMYLLFIALSGISVFTAKNVSLGIVSMAEILVVLVMILNFVILFYNNMYLLYKVAFLVGISAFLQAGMALYNFEIMANNTSVYEALVANSLKGNTGNINIFSASILFKIPFIYIGILNYTKLRRWFLAVALTVATAAIFLINARASLLSLIVITACFLVFIIKNSLLKKDILKKFLFVVIPLIISFFTVNLIFSKADLRGRYISTAERLKQISNDDSSIKRRITFYKASIALANKKPITGIGLGNYRIESIPYDLSSDANAPLHAHNDFLELMAETGYLNGLLYFSIFVALLVVNLKKLIKTTDKEIKNAAMLTLLLLVIYGLDAAFNFPFYRPTMQLCFCFIMVFTLVNSVAIKDTVLAQKRFYYSLIALGLIPLYFTYHAYKTSNLEYMIESDRINFEASGVLKGIDVMQRNPKIPNVFSNSESFVEYAGIYYFREKKYNEAIKLLDSANKINPYLGRADFYKHLIAGERGKTDSAYFYAKKAFYTRPNNNNFYRRAVDLAWNLKDTTEILKIYNTFPSGSTKAGGWAKAFIALNAIGYSKNALDRFKQIAYKNFPNDSAVVKSMNDASITNLIVKGQALVAAGNYEQALETYKEGLKIDPKNIYVMQNIGFYYYNLNKPNQAIPYFKQALNLPGLNDGKTEFFIGVCYSNIGDKENACKYFKLAGPYPGAKIQLDLHCK